MSVSEFRPFGACLSEILARHRLTAASVSRAMGHKSPTTLRRILRDQANSESIKKFLDEFRSTHLIELTPAEESELEQSLEISCLGLKDYLARRSIARLLHTPPRSAAPLSIRIHSGKNTAPISPDQFFERLSGAQSVRLILIDSIPLSLLEALCRRLDHSDHIHIEAAHYLFLNDDPARTAELIASIIPAISYPCYTPYAILKPEAGSAHTVRAMQSILTCRCDFADGSSQEYQIGAASETEGHMVSSQSGLYDFWDGLLDPVKPAALPIRLSAGVTGATLENDLHTAELYRNLEHNRSIYMIKLSLCLAMIPPKVLDRPLRDGMNETAFRSDPALSDFHRRIAEIHESRFSNIYHKKRVSHIILSYPALRSFAETGLLTDHFFGMRAFTVAERREILIHCRNQCRDNPYFNLYFLKNDADPACLEAACYETHGVLLRSPNTDYSPSPGPACALITLQDFTALFTRYFRETLLAQHTHSVSASISILNSLIDELPEE